MENRYYSTADAYKLSLNFVRPWKLNEPHQTPPPPEHRFTHFLIFVLKCMILVHKLKIKYSCEISVFNSFHAFIVV